jgi:leishmanolysin-like peptidase
MLTATMNRLLSISTILNISLCCLAAASSSSIETLQREHADATFLSLDPTDNDGPGGISSIHQRIVKEDRSSWEAFLSRRTPRRERGHVKVEYAAGKHPYERMLEGEVLDITQQLLDDSDQRRRTQRTPQSSYIADEDYTPMRLQFDTHLLDAYTDTYPQHLSYLRNVLLPSLRNFWATTINIVPTKQIEVPLDGGCNLEVKSISGFDLLDFLEYDTTASARSAVPVTNMNNDNVNIVFDGGEPKSITYDNTDLVIIVIPVEGTTYCPSNTNEDHSMKTLAFATNCQNDQLDRPTVGYTGICFGPMDPTDRTSKTHHRRLTTVAHEFTHILGMNSYDIPYYYNPKTGRPRTSRNEYNKPPEENVLCVNGQRQTVEKASSDTIVQVTTANGYVAYEVVTETVRQVVRNQFGCQDLIGGRLENQPTGDDDCYGSHWDHRLYNNEFMAAVYTGSTQYVTALTLALLEDSGW